MLKKTFHHTQFKMSVLRLVYSLSLHSKDWDGNRNLSSYLSKDKATKQEQGGVIFSMCVAGLLYDKAGRDAHVGEYGITEKGLKYIGMEELSEYQWDQYSTGQHPAFKYCFDRQYSLDSNKVSLRVKGLRFVCGLDDINDKETLQSALLGLTPEERAMMSEVFDEVFSELEDLRFAH